MNLFTFDIEANGLYEEADNIWCAVVHVHNHGYLQYKPDQLDDFLSTIDSIGQKGILVGHNVIDYDLPLIEKVLGYRFRGRVLDTLTLSTLLQPDRRGGHSLANWGEFFGVPKPKHEDWSQFSPEMLHRCKEDVRINVRLLLYLLQEANIDERELDRLPLYGT